MCDFSITDIVVLSVVTAFVTDFVLSLLAVFLQYLIDYFRIRRNG